MHDLIGTITRHRDASSVELRRTYRARPDELWSAITEPERLARWLGATRHDARVGGDWLTVFDQDDPSARSFGRIEACEPPRHLRVTWQSPGEPVGTVDLTLQELDEERCELHLVHEGLPHDADTGYAAGWQVHLDQLEAGLAGGEVPDLWDQWPALRERYQATLG